MFEYHVYELKNKDKTKICQYCGKSVKVKIVPGNDLVNDYIKYSCNCKDWIDNTKDDYDKEVARFKRETIMDDLKGKYNPKIHENEAKYYLYCIAVSRGWNDKIIELEKEFKDNELKLKNTSNKVLPKEKSEEIIKKKKKRYPAKRVEHIKSGKSFPSMAACAKYYGISVEKLKSEIGVKFRYLK